MNKLKSAIFFSLILLLSCSNLYAQDSWKQKASFPGNGRQNAAGFSIGNRGYIGTGEAGALNYFNDFWEYDPDNNTWTQKANTGGTTKRLGAYYFSIGNKGYIGGGNGTNDFWEYNPAKDLWTQKANMPGNARIYPMNFSIGSKGYVGLGEYWANGGRCLNDLWEYDTTADKWTQKANFPGVARCQTAGFVLGNKYFVGTGVDSTIINEYADFFEFDPAKNKWTQKADAPFTPRFDGVGFTIAGKGYIGLGYGNGLNTDLWQYDTISKVWTQMKNCDPTFEGIGSTVFTIGNNAFVGTGSFSNNNVGTDLWEYHNHTLGIDEPNAQINFCIFPNPAQNFVSVKSNSTYSSKENFIITDITGKIFVNQENNQSNGSLYTTLDISTLPGGIYFLNIKNDTEVKTLKFVKE